MGYIVQVVALTKPAWLLSILLGSAWWNWGISSGIIVTCICMSRTAGRRKPMAYIANLAPALRCCIARVCEPDFNSDRELSGAGCKPRGMVGGGILWPRKHPFGSLLPAVDGQ